MEAEEVIWNCPERFIMKKARWDIFQHEIKEIREFDKLKSVKEMNEAITDMITDAAIVSIPRTHSQSTARKKKRYTPWWTVECSKMVAARRRARRTLEKYPNVANPSKFRNKRQEAANVVEKAKRTSFEEYISSMLRDTLISEAWKKIKSINSGYSQWNMNIVENSKQIIDAHEKCELFASTFAEINKTKISRENKLKKIQAEQKENGEEVYNRALTEFEIYSTVAKLKSSAPGEDCIHNHLLKNLPAGVVQQLLYMFNVSSGSRGSRCMEVRHCDTNTETWERQDINTIL